MTNLELARAFFAGNPGDLVAAIEDPEWVAAVRQGLAAILAPEFEFVTVNQSVGMPGRRKGIEGFLAAYRAYAEMWESYSLEQDVAAVYTFEN